VILCLTELFMIIIQLSEYFNYISHSNNKKRKGFVGIKLVMANAYDLIELYFLQTKKLFLSMGLSC